MTREQEVDIFTATLILPDKTKIIIPNGQIMNDQVANYTESEDRRLDLVVGIGYEDDIDRAREVLLAAVKESEYVLDEPAPHEVTERVKKALDKAGISIPFPQRDVHVYDKKD